MAVQSLRQPCWAWALQQDGSRLGSSSRRRRKPTSCCRQLHVTCVAQHQASSPSTAAGHVYSEQPPARSNATSLPPPPLLPQQQQPHQPPQLQDARQHHSQREPQQARGKQRRLPDQRLLQCIEACATWVDCLQLLQVHGAGLDPMLVSSLCLHTVHLFSAQQHNTAAGMTGSAITPAHPAPTHAEGSNHSSSQDNSRADSNSYGSRRRGSSRSLTEGAAYTQYMQHLSQLALSAASTGGFSPGRFSNVLWCFARCQHKLPPPWMQQYLWQAQQQLDRFPPRNLAQLIWATASLGGNPSQPFLHAFLLASQRQLQQFNTADLANTLWAFATLGFKPPAPWLHEALAASARCWSKFKPFELSICIWGFAKLGVRFRGPGVVMPAQQQQQQEETAAVVASGSTAAAEAVAAAASSCSAGSPNVSVGWLLPSIALLTPAMGPQEVANLLWGLAVGRAALSEQQVQALGGQVCIILSQAMAPSRPLTASLTVSLWALSNLAWRPTLPQARMIVRLLTDALASGTLDMKHASILVHSLGRLKLRPPAPLMHYMMAAMQQGLQGAGMADVLQVLTGCRLLGWTVPRSWWQAMYGDGQNALQQGTAAELVHLLATVASIRHVNPTAGWWESFWGSLGVELEAAVAAKGLCRIARTQNMPKGDASIAAGPLKARAKQHGLNVAPAQRERRRAQALQARSRGLAAGSSTSGSNSSGGVSGGILAVGSVEQEDCSLTSSISRSSDWVPHPLCWVAMIEALQIVTNLQGISQQQAAHNQLPASTLTAPRACVLLWACVRLSWRPPKLLLWQLLLLVLVDVHSLSPSNLAVALWAVGHMLHKFGRGSVECFKLIQPLALVAQWRLLVGLAGSGQERARVRQALRYLASEDHRLMSLLMLHGEEQRVGL